MYAGRPAADDLQHAMSSSEHGTGHAFESWFYYWCYEVLGKVRCNIDEPTRCNNDLLIYKIS